MKFLITLFIGFFCVLNATSVRAAEVTLPIMGVIDGDTIRTTLPLPCPLCNASIRVLGIDTPEKGSRAKCAYEDERGKKATEFTKKFLLGKTSMVVKNIKWDKYGGRILGAVYIDGKELGSELIKAGLARPYHGEKKASWCK